MKKLIYITIVLFGLQELIAQQYKKTAYGIETTVNDQVISLQFFSSKTIRVFKHPLGKPSKKESLSVIKNPEKTDFKVSEGSNFLEISNSSLLIKLNTKTGKISFSKRNGEKLLTEKDYGAQFTPTKDVDRNTFIVRQSFLLDKEETVYGLGQFQHGKMSQRNQKLLLRQDNLEDTSPVLQSVKGYGIFWDNYSPTYYVDNPTETSFESEVGDLVDYYFMYGENADGVISELRNLTGKAPMFPYWTFGFWQSKERYKSQEETIGVVKKYRELEIPLDGIIQDWQYWGTNYQWNAMEFLNPKFSDPKKMIDDAHALNAHMIISIWSSFGPKTKPFNILKKKNMLMDFKTWPESGNEGWPPDPNLPSGVRVYDAYNPEARDIYWDYLNKGIFSLGMDGWWMDSTDPDHLDVKDHDFDNMTHLGSFRKVRNAFPLMTVGGVYDHQRETTSDKRVFILTRSAFTGQQRYGANTWSGDVVTNWENFRKQISAGLNFSLTGIPYWNSDIGGFFVWDFPGGYKNKAFHEIYVRWMQFGAFCPMMRSHGTTTPRELWYYGKEGDWTYDALKKMIELRYSLLPYIYSNSWDITQNNSSIMRALFMDFPKDKNVWDIDNQYMFGKNILVSPVTEAMYVTYRKEGNKYYAENEDFSEIKTSNVYLPSGTKWYNFWTGELLNGGQTIASKAPIDILPLFVKAGSIIPFGPKVQYANEKIGPLTIRVYPGADASFTFYDDERDNYNYENGAYSTIDMKWNEKSNTFTIEAQKGKYKGMQKSRKISIIKMNNEKGFYSEDKPEKVIKYRGRRIKVKL